MKKILFFCLFSILSLTISAHVNDTVNRKIYNIAIYVTGSQNNEPLPSDLQQIIQGQASYKLMKNGKYRLIERSKDFEKKMQEELVKQVSGDVADNQIAEVGEEFGAERICVVEVNIMKKYLNISARIVDVVTRVACESAVGGIKGYRSPFDIQKTLDRVLSKLNRPYVIDKFLDFFRKKEKATFPLKKFSDGTEGIIFYTDKNNHGLAVSLESTILKWENVKKRKDCRDILAVPNNEGTKKCTYLLGNRYTESIVNDLGVSAQAASWCMHLGNGWYLPSAGELWYMLSVANNGAGADGSLSQTLLQAGGAPLDKSWYWSSTERNATEAININRKGRMSGESKTKEIPVRAIRAF